ncbi:MAG: diacylglycerol kinase family lipid kinase [Chloroflexi bacterium]|nr:diacylglycerol kinase family lipid kinase [Chloroflexota bacterium]
MAKYKIIVNPTSGRGVGGKSVPRIEQIMNDHHLDFDIVRTERPWHAVDLAQEAAITGYDVVVAAGGDGTANEVLNGLMRAKQSGANTCAMGILCVGRGNDLAYGMNIPAELEAGCKALIQGCRRTVDVGRVVGGLYPEGRYFGNGVGIGFDTIVGFEAAKMTWLTGFPSYIAAVLKTVFLYYNAPRTTIEYDDQTLTQPSLMISVMNGQRLGGGFFVTPDAQPNDGLFDLCITHGVSRTRTLGLIPHFLRGTQAAQEPVKMGQARKVTITALEGVLPAHADGETLCTNGQKLEIELLPSQIDVICLSPEDIE